MKKDSLIGALMLALCSFIWGLTFVAQSTGAEHFSPMWFTFLRNALAVLVLSPVILFSDVRKKRKGIFTKHSKPEKRLFFIGTAICGFCLCVAAYLQQLGITLGTSPGKAGFITSLYIILVPIFSLFFKKKPSPAVWLCALVCVAGLYLLCVKEDFSVKKSDFIVLSCAFAFAIQILAIEFFSVKFDGVKFAAAQFFFCSVFAFVYAVIFEKLTLQNIKDGLFPLLYAGILASGVAYTLQITGQKRLSNPTVASMIMSFESVFGALSSAVILHQILQKKEIVGCVIIFIAIIAAQIPLPKTGSKPKRT